MKHWILLITLIGLLPTTWLSGQTQPYVQVLGIAQDAGYPQAGCQRSCCHKAWKDNDAQARVACIAVVIPAEQKYYLIDATPDLKNQMHDIEQNTGFDLGGIFLTHAHIGHYTGLMHFGREVMGSKSIPVYAMPRMKAFLTENGPWSQLVGLGNIEIKTLHEGEVVNLGSGIGIVPYTVPHRDEFSETVGFYVKGTAASGWYIPDIDKWDQWSRPLEDLLKDDFIFADGTFYRNGEIFGRDMSQIPHPFVEETIARLTDRDVEERRKVIFIHLNHTNPLLWDPGTVREVEDKGYRVAHRDMKVFL